MTCTFYHFVVSECFYDYVYFTEFFFDVPLDNLSVHFDLIYTSAFRALYLLTQVSSTNSNLAAAVQI